MEPVKQQGTSRLMGLSVIRGRRALALANCNKTSVATLRTCSSRAFLSLVVISMSFLADARVGAQVNGATGPADQTHRVHRRPSIDDRVKLLAKNLDLTESQQAAVKKILEQRQQAAIRLRLDPSISGSARIDRFRALQDKTVERIQAVLNEEQKKKYDPLAVRGIPPAPDQRSVEDWLKVTMPQQ